MDVRNIFAYPLFMFQGPSTRKAFVVACKKCLRDVPTGVAEFPSNPSLWSAHCAARSAATCPPRSSLAGSINWWRARSGLGGAEVRSRRQHAAYQPGNDVPGTRNRRQIAEKSPTFRHLPMALGTSRLFPGFCPRGSRESHRVMHWRLDGRRRSGEDWIEASP